MKRILFFNLFILQVITGYSQEVGNNGRESIKQKNYYENGQVRVTCTQQGLVKTYHENGKLRTLGKVVNIKNNVINPSVVIQYMLNGGRDGKIESADMAIQYAHLIRKNKINALNQLEFEYVIDSINKIYYSDGKLHAIFHFNNGIPLNDYYTEFSKTNVKIKSTSFINDSTIIDSKYYENGTLRKERTYNNGVLLKEVEFHENGNQGLVYNFLNGVPNGEVKSFYPDGKLKSYFMMVNGKIEGQGKLYYQNGNLQALLTYENGQKVKEIEFHENTKIKSETTYSQGQEIKKTIYDLEGVEIKNSTSEGYEKY